MKKSVRDKKIEKIILAAVVLVGTPYQYGAYAAHKEDDPPRGVDCSSFIQYVFSRARIALPRSSILQAQEGRTVKNKRALAPGDLLFFEGDKGHYFHTLFKKKIYIGHVALYCGKNTIIHAQQSKGGVVVDRLDAFMKNKYCEIVRIRRII